MSKFAPRIVGQLARNLLSLTTSCSNPLAFYRNLTTMHGGRAMPPDSRQVDMQQERGERKPAPTLGPALQELATAAGADDGQLTEPKLLPDQEELRRIIDLIPQTIVVLSRDGKKCAPITSGIACSIQKTFRDSAKSARKVSLALFRSKTSSAPLARMVNIGGF